MMHGKKLLLVMSFLLFLSGCNEDRVDLTPLAESKEMIIGFNDFKGVQDGKRVIEVGDRAKLKEDRDLKKFYNIVNNISLTKISSKKAMAIMTANDQPDSIFNYPPMDNGNLVLEGHLSFTFYEDGTITMIIYEDNIGKHFYRADQKDKEVYKQIYDL